MLLPGHRRRYYNYPLADNRRRHFRAESTWLLGSRPQSKAGMAQCCETQHLFGGSNQASNYLQGCQECARCHAYNLRHRGVSRAPHVPSWQQATLAVP
ncbi:hypothetical protein VTI74DRAFT_6461 [Chaetomium olivicolor]